MNNSFEKLKVWKREVTDMKREVKSKRIKESVIVSLKL